ncbi:low affinity immunoglobulin gamma Fc region receptor II-b isoform X7 [Castor canadensis]|uniref:low affinity immunoglobulin gamma Fc region receptor II-b isoform X7 n=1 Tax=Castor canadensis TaxID=51338 RepID=UPI000981FCA0|nr:low affinity immunoglobulin gamma Fc region receptor II-b isoform X1 [Castor canadensis]
MGILSFLLLPAIESDWADFKFSQTLGHMLLWTAVLCLALVTGTSAALPKAVVKLEPPWIQVLQEDSVTLRCQGSHDLWNHSTQWFHNGSPIPTQVQPSYEFKAKINDSGEYRCQMIQTSLSDPVHLGVISDWLLLQTPQLVFQEGETILLRCHSWKNNLLNKIIFYQNGKSKKFSHFSGNLSIPKANHSHSGDYYCKANIGKMSYTSQSVAITVQGFSPPGSKSSDSSLVWTIVAVVTGIAVVVIIVTIAALSYLKRKWTPAFSGNPEHREMGETLPEEPAGSTDPEEAAKAEAENTITYSLLMHPEAPEEGTEPDYENQI